ncbi:MAG: carbohydrate kinase family protein [Candidatus Paceibacterota bacterium]|jgi:sugar/nucleoside kinase (ribokinase family)
MFDVITLGTVTNDLFLESKLFKPFHDSNFPKKDFPTGSAECFALGSKLYIDALTQSVGGDAANAAVTFSRQGFQIGFIGKIGTDENTKTIEEKLKKEKIKLLTKSLSKRQTDTSIILLSPSGERTILVSRGASNDFCAKDIPVVKTKWWYIAPGKISSAIILNLVKSLKKEEVHIAFNPSGHYIEHERNALKAICGYSDVVIVNREEGAKITEKPYEKIKDTFKAFDALVHGVAVLTDGPNGAYVSDGRMMYRSRAFKEKKLVDRTGAGDAFGSGFIAGFIQKNDIGYALRLASANATSVVEHIGAQGGILSKRDFLASRWKFVDLDVESLHS